MVACNLQHYITLGKRRPFLSPPTLPSLPRLSMRIATPRVPPAGRTENCEVDLPGERPGAQGREVQVRSASADVAGHRRAGSVQLRHGRERPRRHRDEVRRPRVHQAERAIPPLWENRVDARNVCCFGCKLPNRIPRCLFLLVRRLACQRSARGFRSGPRQTQHQRYYWRDPRFLKQEQERVSRLPFPASQLAQ